MIKQFIKKALIVFRIDLTKNIHYDRLTLNVLDKVLVPDSNCIDIGCHKGEIMDEILKRSPKGKHIGFEPIPPLYKQLKEKYHDRDVDILDVALSNTKGETTFNYVIDAPAYSGLKQREYKIKNPKIDKINVRLELLDELLPDNYNVDLIKLDVEGAEYDVLKGAQKTLKNFSPVVIFEFGLGASDHYNVDPSDFFDFITSDCKYNIYLLQAYLHDKAPLEKQKFIDVYQKNQEYYFIASPLKKSN